VAPPKPREIAYQALRRVDSPGDFLEHRLEEDAGFGALREDDRRLVQELVFGIVRRRATLDWLIALRTDGRRQRPDIRHLLHLGLYQLVFLNRIPSHAAVNETVAVARTVGLGAQSGFLNAVLRETIRNLPATHEALARLVETDLATFSSHPEWLVARWVARYGEADTRQLLALNNLAPKTFARANPLRMEVDELQRLWVQEGVVAERCEFSWSSSEGIFELKQHPRLAGLTSFQRGGFYVQDPSTVLAVKLLDPRPGEEILDTCAAPGGKTVLMAARMQNRGGILAEDANPDRLPMLRENVDRLGASCVTVPPVGDRGSTALFIAGTSQTFDRVLVDAPCSNTGVLRRRVELRWRLQPEIFEKLRVEQLEILRRAAARVRPGGVLVYSTCSLEPEENAEVATDFLRLESQFTEDVRQEILPWRDHVDGAFGVRFRRTP